MEPADPKGFAERGSTNRLGHRACQEARSIVSGRSAASSAAIPRHYSRAAEIPRSEKSQQAHAMRAIWPARGSKASMRVTAKYLMGGMAGVVLMVRNRP